MFRALDAGVVRPRLAGALALLLTASACESEPEMPSVIRLADRLAESALSTPLDGIEAAADVGELAEPVSRRSLRVPLGRVAEASPSCELHELDAGGRKLSCDSGSVTAFPVSPGRHYRVGALLRLEDAQCRSAKLELVETTGGRRRLRIHRFEQVLPGDWRESITQLFTTQGTQSLVLAVPDAECPVSIRDLWLEELDLSREQELALFKGRKAHLREVGRVAHPLLDRGRLLPLPLPEAGPPTDDNYTVRDVIFAPAPSDLIFDVRIPERSRLHFACGLSRYSKPEDVVEFEILAREAGREEELFRTTLNAAAAKAWRWHPFDVDLARFAGRSIQLELRTRAPRGRGYGLWGAPYIARDRDPQDPPNVVLIAVDTLRADRVSAYGRARTPRIMALAAEGIRFEQAISSANWTSPAFHALFAGLAAPDAASHVSPAHVTLAERLRSAGWVTQGFAYKPALYDAGFEQGFDGYFNVPRPQVRGSDSVDKAIAWLEAHHRERFFLFLHLNDPHQPFTQPVAFLSDDDVDRIQQLGAKMPMSVQRSRAHLCEACWEDGVFVPEARELARGLYDGEVRYADHEVGRFLDALQRLGIYDDSVIAFFSDHGESLWQHDDHYSHGGRGLFDELVRVPLILKPAGRSPGGRVVRSQVRLADLAPTLLELAGLEAPAVAHAASLLPLLEEQDPRDRPALSRGEGSISLRAHGWKYVRRLDTETDRTLEQLFDLRGDPGELRDRSAEEPERLARMRGELAHHILRARTLHSVVIAGPGDGREHSVRIRASGARFVPELAYPSLRRKATGDGLELTYTGRLDGPLLAIVPFLPAAGARYQVEIAVLDDPTEHRKQTLRPDGARPAAPGLLAPTAPPAGFTLSLIGMPPSEVTSPATPQVIDAQNVEALRALGYLE